VVFARTTPSFYRKECDVNTNSLSDKARIDALCRDLALILDRIYGRVPEQHIGNEARVIAYSTQKKAQEPQILQQGQVCNDK
jgi:viroplasmin and RNaseH domain-containing protein